MVAELRELSTYLQRCPTLLEYLAETRYELGDIYKSSVGGWGALLIEADDYPERSADEALLSKHFQLLLHVDSTRRLKLYLRLLQGPEMTIDELPALERRMTEMLTFRLLSREDRQRECDWDTGLKRLQGSASASGEFQELCSALLDRVKLHSDESPLMPDCPIFLHRQYTRDEVLVALGLPKLVGARHTQTRRFWIEETNTEIFFVTLDKSESAFSPSTRYEDYAVSPTRFHWQSQSTTSEESATGQRYVRQKVNGTNFLLFVRPRKGDSFLFLGPLHYVSHSGSRPMSIYWDLDHSLPARFLETCASVHSAWSYTRAVVLPFANTPAGLTVH
jgi:hypothetical protein